MMSPRKRGRIAALACFGLALLSRSGLEPRAHPATRATDEKPSIPRDLFFESKPIPDEDNAIYLWRRSAKVLVKPDDKTTEAIRYAWDPESPIPGDDEEAAIRHWLTTNQEGLGLIQLSLKKTTAKWLAKKGEEEQPELWSLAHLARARAVMADQLATQGKWAEAAALLKDNLRLAQVAIESEAALVHYLVGTGVRTFTQRAMIRLANHRDTPIPTIRQLLEALPSLESETNTYSRLLNVEFTVYAYPGMDVRWFAEAWAKPEARNLLSLTYPEEFQRPFMVLTDPGLVALHPKPFDQLAELQRALAKYRRYRTNALSCWTNRVEADDAALEKLQTELRAEIEPLMDLVAEESLPLNQKAVARVRTRYLALTDPIGRILQCGNTLLSGDDLRVFRSRTEREAGRAVLGCILFERQKGQLPVTLQELTDEKLLAQPPWDYFANAPMRYSKSQRRIWSAGEDAENDDGDGSPDAPWGGLDAVWNIPNRIK